MSRIKLYSLVSGIIITVILIFNAIYSSNNFSNLTYLSDYVKSIFGFTGGSDSRDFSIIDPAVFKKYKKTYSNLPSAFIHSGNMLFYKAKNGQKLRDISRQAVIYTQFYNAIKLEQAVRAYNNLPYQGTVKDGLIYIPQSLPLFSPYLVRQKKPDMFPVRGLYFSGLSMASDNIFKKIDEFKRLGINAVVFDVKDVTGIVNYYSNVPDVLKYNTHEKRPIDDIDKLIRILKQQNIYVIARIAVFRDHLLSEKNPAYAIKSRRTGGIWSKGAKEIWTDPTNKYVQDYNLGMAIELAEKGVDEIQFDYIRFATGGDQSDAYYDWHFGKMSKQDAIIGFLKQAYAEISKRNVLLSLDIFGVVAWGKEVDIQKTGQRVDVLSKYCDVLSPMLYPSHFGLEFDGLHNPANEPYYFLKEGTAKTAAIANGKKIRPWLQAFKWRVANYNEDYLLQQIAGAKDGGAFGYLFWSSSNNYDVVYRALNRLVNYNKKDKDKLAGEAVSF